MTRRLTQDQLDLLRIFASAPGNRICPGEGVQIPKAFRKLIKGLVDRGFLTEAVFDDGVTWSLTAAGMVEVDNG